MPKLEIQALTEDASVRVKRNRLSLPAYLCLEHVPVTLGEAGGGAGT